MSINSPGHAPVPWSWRLFWSRFPVRGLLIGLLLCPLAAYWAVDQPVDIFLSLMVPPVAMTMLVVLASRGVGVLFPSRMLRTGDLVVVYAILSVGTAVSAEWSLTMTPLIYSYALFANPANKLADFLPDLPSFLFIKDASKLQDFKQGGRGFLYFAAHLHLWWGPVLWWTGIVFLLTFAMLCINNLMREEWTRREKLSFPHYPTARSAY